MEKKITNQPPEIKNPAAMSPKPGVNPNPNWYAGTTQPRPPRPSAGDVGRVVLTIALCAGVGALWAVKLGGC